MTDNRVQIDLVAENADLRAKLNAAEADIKAMQQRVNTGGKEASAGFEDAAKAAGVFARVMRFVAVPSIIITTATRLTTIIQDWIDRTRIFKEELREAARVALEASRNEQFAARGDAGKRAADRVKLAEEEQAAIAKIEEQGGLVTLLERERVYRRIVELSEKRLNAKLPRASGEVQQLEEVRRQITAIEKSKEEVRTSFAKRRDENTERDRRDARKQLEAQRIQLASNDPELKAKLELEREKREIELQFRGETNKELLAMQAELLANVEELSRRSLERIRAEQRRQIREMENEVRAATEQGFGISAGAPSFAGTGTAMQFFQDNLASFARTASGGR